MQAKTKPTSTQLPKPDSLAQAHSEQVKQYIANEIKGQGNAIPFERFMELALYAPGLGYYSAGKTKFGRAGDFITAPEAAPIFSKCLAKQCAQVLEVLPEKNILELGAGSGALAVEVLKTLDEFGALPAHYFILEVSADLREQQQQSIRQHCPQWFDCVTWLDVLPKTFSGVIVANEVIDALPIHKVIYHDNEWQEYYVSLDEDENFIWHLAPLTQSALANPLKHVAKQHQLPQPYTTEINLRASGLIRSLSHMLAQGVMFFIDYGFPEHEYYLAQRNQGTVMCHYLHHAHQDPLLYPGIQDITAHVDFTALAQAAHDNGLTLAGYTHQAAFLMNSGLIEFMNEQTIFDDYELNQQVKLLTLPSEMGELFKVIAFERNIEIPLMGFSNMDKSHQL